MRKQQIGKLFTERVIYLDGVEFSTSENSRYSAGFWSLWYPSTHVEIGLSYLTEAEQCHSEYSERDSLSRDPFRHA